MSAGELEYDLDIPRLSLDEALKSLARQSDVQLLFPFDLVRSLNANPVKGRYTLAQALEILLKDTGLSGDLTGSGVITISRAKSVGAPEGRMGESVSNNKKAGLGAILAAVFSVGAGAQDANASSDVVAETSVVTGKVTDARTGANLKGALVTIEEAGRSTSTNDLGEFRFANMPAGTATLSVSFLGYAAQSAVIDVRGDSVSQRFALRGGMEMEEIVVFGRRSARALALNQERTAENTTTVVSSDLLGQFSGTTISEALRRAPGISFEQDFATGDGTNITVRGATADLNTVKLNGVELPERTGTGRSADLGNILADSVGSIVVSKTLLPNQDSAGIGGLVEIETKSPLDRSTTYLNGSIQRTDRGGDFGEDLFGSITASKRFGSNDSFGLSLSGQYRERDARTLQYQALISPGDYLPLDIDGTPISTTLFIDPTSRFPFETGNDSLYYSTMSATDSYIEDTNTAVTISAHWLPADHTSLRFDAQHSATEEAGLDVGTSLSPFEWVTLAPVEATGGGVRGVPNVADFGSGLFFNTFNQSYSVQSDFETETDTYSFRGETAVDSWTFNYSAGHAKGSFDAPDQTTIDFGLTNKSLTLDNFLPDAVDTNTGLVRSVFGPADGGYPGLALSQLGRELVTNPSEWSMLSGSITPVSGETKRDTAEMSIRYDFQRGGLEYIEIGLDYEKSHFFQELSPGTFFFAPLSMSDLGLAFDTNNLSDIGQADVGLPTVSPGDIGRLIDDIDNLIESGAFQVAEVPFDERSRGEFTEEEEFAYFVQGRYDIGRLELIGGVRISDVEILSERLNLPFVFDENFVQDLAFSEEFGQIVPDSASQVEVLPRILANYRISDRFVIRAGYFMSVARPRVSDISDTKSIILTRAPIFGPDSDQFSLQVSEGNPELKPAITHNLDLSVELYAAQAGVIKAGVFYKRIDNLVETNKTGALLSLAATDLPDHPYFNDLTDENTDTTIFKPVNAEDPADIWGFELAVERQFSRLPGIWSGLGVYANYTYTDSSKTALVDWPFSPVVENGAIVGREDRTLEVKDEPFDGSPSHSGTAAVTYSKHGFDGQLSYTYQDRRQSGYGFFRLSPFVDKVDSVDFRLQYQFTPTFSGSNASTTFRAFVEANDILKDNSDAGIRTGIGGNGAPAAISGASYLGGRSVVLGLSATF